MQQIVNEFVQLARCDSPSFGQVDPTLESRKREKRVNVRVDGTVDGLCGWRRARSSKFVENVVRPHIHQLDPGESCKILGEFDQKLRNEIVTALSKHNFEKAATLATIGDVLTPFMCLCRIPTGDASESEEHP